LRAALRGRRSRREKTRRGFLPRLLLDRRSVADDYWIVPVVVTELGLVPAANGEPLTAPSAPLVELTVYAETSPEPLFAT
jgi:hypothetical protein